MSSLTNIASGSLPPESETDTSATRPSLAISEHSLIQDVQSYIEGLRMSSPPASPASRSASQESSAAQMTSATCGPPPSQPSAWFDPDTLCLRTYQACLIPGISEPSLETWPRAGMVYDGAFYPQPNWERRISEIGSGLWPTPVAQDDGKTPEAHMRMKTNMKGGARKKITSLTVMVKAIAQGEYKEMWPTYATPQARDWRTGSTNRWADPNRSRNLNDQIGGQLNPMWVSWLMGFPIGWLSLKPLETPKFLAWLRGHGIY